MTATRSTFPGLHDIDESTIQDRLDEPKPIPELREELAGSDIVVGGRSSGSILPEELGRHSAAWGLKLLAIAMSVAAFCGCTTVHDQPLLGGHYKADTLNTEAALHPLELDVDLAASRATLSFHDEVVQLKLSVLRDKETWRTGCGTHTSHSRLGTANITPQRFTIAGKARHFNVLTSACVSGIELRGDASQQRWLFEKR